MSAREAPCHAAEGMADAQAEGALPCAADRVERWFEPLLAQRLAQAGMGTLGVLARRIDDAGARWWYPVRGMGVTRAARVEQWLRAQPGALGLARPRVPAAPAAGHAAAPVRRVPSEPNDWTRQLRALEPVEH